MDVLYWIVLNEICVYGAHRSNYVRNVGHCGARGSSQIHDLCSGLDVDLVYSSQDGCCQLGAEWIPGSVFNLSLSFLTDKE